LVRRDKTLSYGAATPIDVTVKPEDYLMIQASASGTRTLCQGDLSLVAG
jgi:hypothetical protein